MKQENQLPLRGGRMGHAIPAAGKGDNDDGITPLPSVATMLAKPTILEGKPSPPVGSSLNSTPWNNRPTGFQFGRRRVIPRVKSPTKLVQPEHEAVKEHGLSRILTAIWSRCCFVRVASWALPIVLFIMQIVHTPSTPSIVESYSHMAESSCHSDRGYATEDGRIPLQEGEDSEEPNPVRAFSKSALVNDDESGFPSEIEWLLSPRADHANDEMIPKLLHKVYFQNDGNFQPWESMDPSQHEAHASWSRMNPEYDVRYYNLRLARVYLHRYFHEVFLRTFDCLQAYAAKADFFHSPWHWFTVMVVFILIGNRFA